MGYFTYQNHVSKNNRQQNQYFFYDKFCAYRSSIYFCIAHMKSVTYTLKQVQDYL